MKISTYITVVEQRTAQSTESILTARVADLILRNVTTQAALKAKYLRTYPSPKV